MDDLPLPWVKALTDVSALAVSTVTLITQLITTRKLLAEIELLKAGKETVSPIERPTAKQVYELTRFGKITFGVLLSFCISAAASASTDAALASSNIFLSALWPVASGLAGGIAGYMFVDNTITWPSSSGPGGFLIGTAIFVAAMSGAANGVSAGRAAAMEERTRRDTIARLEATVNTLKNSLPLPSSRAGQRDR